LDANKVNVGVINGEITLTGDVSSWSERDEAENAAWAAPGVTRVQNQLSVHTL
jgi:osmotically-inducible protein OsmY